MESTKTAMEAFEKLEKVGEGTYDKVYKASDKITGQIVALKKTNFMKTKKAFHQPAYRKTVFGQMDVKQGINKNGNTVLYLVFEYMDTDLKKFIRSFHQTGENIPSNIVKSLMYQLCKGVAFCHALGVLHRDPKPHNDVDA